MVLSVCLVHLPPEMCDRRALAIARKVYGPEHADVATYLNNLARVLKAQVSNDTKYTRVDVGDVVLAADCDRVELVKRFCYCWWGS